MAPLIGRLVDRGLGPHLLVGGAGLGAAALAALTLVQTPTQFVLVWAVIGMAQAASLYEVCFAFLTRVTAPTARPAITRVTLVAGFASTLAFPAGALMADAFGWRGAVLGYAAAQLLLAVPVNLLAVRRFPAVTVAGQAAAVDHRAGLTTAIRRAEFWLLALVFGLIALNHGLLLTYFLPIFADRGASPVLAVAAAACVGPAQVAGRVALMLNEARIGTGFAVRIGLVWMLLGGLVLGLATLAPLLIFVFALLQGAALGMESILKPVLIAETLGRAGFGAIAGVIAIAPLAAAAASPFLGALLIEGIGVSGLLVVTFGMAALALAAALVLRARAAAAG